MVYIHIYIYISRIIDGINDIYILVDINEYYIMDIYAEFIDIY